MSYLNKWNKKHPEKMREYQKAYRVRHKGVYSKKEHITAKAKLGCSQTTALSRKSELKATATRTRWGEVDDEILMSGLYTQGQLVDMLGRSIRAIQRRKHKIRSFEKDSNDKMRRGEQKLN